MWRQNFGTRVYWRSLHGERCFIRKSWRSYRRDRSSRRGCNRWAEQGCTNGRADRRRCKENVGRGGQCGRRRSTRHDLRCELKGKKCIFGGRSQPVSHTNSQYFTPRAIDRRTAYQSYGGRSDATFMMIKQGLHDKRLTRSSS